MSISEIVKQSHAQFEVEDFYPASLITNETAKQVYENQVQRNLVLYEEVIKFAMSCNINPDDIYFSSKGICTYYYFKFPAIVDIFAISSEYAKQMKVEEHITQVTRVLQEKLDERLYDDFFIYVDSRIQMMAFIKLFKQLPDNKKYDFFISVYIHGEYNFQLLRPYMDMVMESQDAAYRENMLSKLDKVTEDEDFITIYRGQGTDSTPYSEAMSWTLSLKTALFFAKRYNMDGVVYQAKVRKKDVIDYINSRHEEEILVKPATLIEVKDLNYIKTSEEINHLNEIGMLSIFHEYKKQLDESLFLNPYGIHGLKHTERVMIHLVSLVNELSLDDEDVDVLMRAALFHDIGRTHDGVDDLHGEKSWEMVEEMNLLSFDSNFKFEEWEEENEETIEFIIKNHCLDDATGYRNLEKMKSHQAERIEYLFRIFKDADGLDRVRLGDLDPNYLRLEESKKRILFAEGLYTGHR